MGLGSSAPRLGVPGLPGQDLASARCGLQPGMCIPCWISGQGVPALPPLLSLQLVPQRSSSVTLECTSPPNTLLQSMMDFEEFVPPVPPPPYYPPEYTCSSETDAQRYVAGSEAGGAGPPWCSSWGPVCPLAGLVPPDVAFLLLPP